MTKNIETKTDLDNELKISKDIEKFLKCTLTKTPKFSVFDFVDEEKKICVEIKNRNNTKDKYKDTMIGFNKITRAQDILMAIANIYFFIQFTDGLYYYKFDKINPEWVRMGGRYDRGKPERKLYYFVPVDKLIKI